MPKRSCAAVRWGDIDWEHDPITLYSVKTEHHEEKASRAIPLFGELRPYLERGVRSCRARDGDVITRYRDILRSPLKREYAWQESNLRPTV